MKKQKFKSKNRICLRRWYRTKLFALLMAIMLFAVFGLSGCGKDKEGKSTSSETIKIGISAYPSWYVWFIAKEKNMFEEKGLNVELVYFPTYSDSLQSFLTGDLDYVSLALSDTIAPYVKGEGHKIILINDYSNGADGLVAAPDIKSIKDLKGRTVATEYGTIEHFFLLRLLEENGMSEDDIKFNNMTIGDSGFAFLGEAVDAASLWEPALSQAQEREGTNTLYTSKETPGLIPSVLVVNKNHISGYEEEMEKILNVWFDSLEFYAENPDEAIEYMAKDAEISEDEMLVTMSGSKLYSLDENISAMTDEKESFEYIPYTAKVTAEFLKKVNLVEDEAEDYTGMFDVTYLQNVAKTRESVEAPDTSLK